MLDTKTVYRFDSAGYYLGTSLAQFVGESLLLPSDCTETQPKQKDGCWSKWNGSKWVNEKIPTSCAECIEQKFTCISNSPDRHEQEKKAVIESLVNSDKEHYKTVVSDDFVMSIEEIPEPTEEEKKAKLSSELRAKRDAELNATDFYLMPDYPISSELLVQIKDYRQQLRDLPQQEGFPYVDFPVNPISK